jgi:hypothetical protein
VWPALPCHVFCFPIAASCSGYVVSRGEQKNWKTNLTEKTRKKLIEKTELVKKTD